MVTQRFNEGRSYGRNVATGFVEVYTNAPEAYDYGYAHTLAKVGDDGLRVVQIPAEYVEIQTERYFSGLYWSTQDAEDAALRVRLSKK